MNEDKSLRCGAALAQAHAISHLRVPRHPGLTWRDYERRRLARLRRVLWLGGISMGAGLLWWWNV